MKIINHEQLNKVGGVAVFTIQGAANAYKQLAAYCYENLTMESSVVLSNEAQKLHAMGFNWEEIEELELLAIGA